MDVSFSLPVPAVGFEPLIALLRVECSATELQVYSKQTLQLTILRQILQWKGFIMSVPSFQITSSLPFKPDLTASSAAPSKRPGVNVIAHFFIAEDKAK